MSPLGLDEISPGLDFKFPDGYGTEVDTREINNINKAVKRNCTRTEVEMYSDERYENEPKPNLFWDGERGVEAMNRARRLLATRFLRMHFFHLSLLSRSVLLHSKV